jgi:hypothetical protein
MCRGDLVVLGNTIVPLVGNFVGGKWVNNNWRNLLRWDCDNFQVSRRRAAVKTPDD